MPDRPYLFAVPLSVGCAVVCEHCNTTIAITFTPADAVAIIHAHTCTTRSEQVTVR